MAGLDLSQYVQGGATRPDAISGLNPQFRQSIADMFAAAPSNIQQQLRITSAYRSPARQAEILAGSLAKRQGPDAVARWNSYVQQANGDVVSAGQAARSWLRSIGATKWVAPPGRSNHQKGVAMDLGYLDPAATQWAHANAPKYGLNFPLSNEDWHIEPAGIRHGGVAPAGMAVASAAPSVPLTPGPQPGGSLANMFAAPDLSPGPPVMDAPSLGLAAMFMQQQNARQQREQQEQDDLQARRQALFGGTSGIASLYG